jgi:predicted amidophosphoribosyltransferase
MDVLTRRLIHLLKYRGIPGMATYLVNRSGAMRSLQGNVFSDFSRPLFFVPVPLHRARFRERGYNQAEMIARALASLTSGQICRWLKRKTFRVSQTKLSRERREENEAGAFDINLPKKLPARGTVIIVDDVFTTGATTGACIDAFGKDFPLDIKVCTLLYDKPLSATMDYVADCRAFGDYC